MKYLICQIPRSPDVSEACSSLKTAILNLYRNYPQYQAYLIQNWGRSLAEYPLPSRNPVRREGGFKSYETVEIETNARMPVSLVWRMGKPGPEKSA